MAESETGQSAGETRSAPHSSVDYSRVPSRSQSSSEIEPGSSAKTRMASGDIFVSSPVSRSPALSFRPLRHFELINAETVEDRQANCAKLAELRCYGFGSKKIGINRL